MRRVRARFLGLLFAALAIAPAAAAEITRVLDVRVGPGPSGTRLVIDSNKPLNYRVFSLSAGAERIIIDLPKLRWSVGGLTAESGTGPGEGLIAGYRYAHNAADSSRLVLDLAKPAEVARQFALEPEKAQDAYRLVLDLKPTSMEAFVQSSLNNQARPPPTTHKPAKKPLIVIDPGHGGKDPGALAKSGRKEKDVTLAAARELRDQLIQGGRYEVALTRDDDRFIELEDRVTIARELGANLFISLHADAGANSNTRGSSVYTLSSDGEKRVETERHKQDWVLSVERDRTRPVEVNEVLADLVQRETKNQSARFAQMLVPSLAEVGWAALQNPHRQRGFYVLLSPDVPAVLLEMGFMTNIHDEANLATEKQRSRMVGAIHAAIDEFFETEAQALAMR